MADQWPWQPWQRAEVAHRLRDVSTPWWIVAGCALDLFHGTQTREHNNKIGIPRTGGIERI